MKIAAYLVLAFILAGTWGAIVGTYIDEVGRQIDHHVGSYLVKDRTMNLYRVTYDVEILGGNLVMNLDSVRGLRNVQCDISNIELLVSFTNNGDALNFYKIMSSSSADRFITGSMWNCTEDEDGGSILMRRVLRAEISGSVVLLHTAQGHYEESIKDGVITLDKADQPEDHSKTFCLGVNSNQDCTASKGPIPIYENPYISLTCADCFVGAKATVFLDLQISWFKLKRIASGLKDINVNAAFVLDLSAHVDWSAGREKIYKIVDQAVIISFWIGPIPISIWYEIPLQLIANAHIDAKAQLVAGAKANWKIGDAYLSWDDTVGWKFVKPNPVFTWEPVLHGEASFNADANLQIIPSFILHVMRILQMGIKMTPQLMFEAHGDTVKKELCADMSYQVSADARAEVHINIPFIRINYDKVFGPYSIFDTGVKPIGHWCVKR